MDNYSDTVERLYFWVTRSTGCFSDMLFDLICKADPSNLAKLRLSFPMHCQVIDEWQVAGDNGMDLFKKVGILDPVGLHHYPAGEL